MSKNSKKLIIGIIVVIAVSIGGTFLYLNKDKTETPQENLLSSQEAAQKVINYINDNLTEGGTASLVEVIDGGQIYKIRLEIQNNEYNSYVTKDGKYLFPEGYDLDAELENQEQESEEQELSKSEKPDVKLFVMSYCPFGLQAQKMFLPVYDLLKEKTEMSVYFVNYIMHEKKEIDENLRQYCIQKEEKEKHYDYLSCFVKDGNFEQCLTDAKIDKEKLNSCISATDKEYSIYSQYEDKSSWLNGRFPRFDVHADLNQQYEVSGSPTVVINDKKVGISPRSPEKFKEVVCQSFNSQPQECSQTLSDTAFSPGFGLQADGLASDGGCGP